MSFTPLSIEGVWLHSPEIWPDLRGSFHENFKLSEIESQLSRSFDVRQVNQSTSKKGVIRGIHVTTGVKGQAKYVSCPKGAIWDFVVDLRRGSKTYGTWTCAILSSENRKSILISEGIGHGFLALEEDSVAHYLCNSEFQPNEDKAINPLDKDLGIDFESQVKEFDISKLILSEKDAQGLDFKSFGSI